MAEYDRIAHLEEQLALALRTVDRFADTITQQKSALTQSQAELEGMLGTCVWVQECEDDDFYETACGNAFSLNDGTPEANGMKHCCYCGKTLEQSLWRETTHE